MIMIVWAGDEQIESWRLFNRKSIVLPKTIPILPSPVKYSANLHNLSFQHSFRIIYFIGLATNKTLIIHMIHMIRLLLFWKYTHLRFILWTSSFQCMSPFFLCWLYNFKWFQWCRFGKYCWSCNMLPSSRIVRCLVVRITVLSQSSAPQMQMSCH